VKEYLRENPALVEEITRKNSEKRGLLSPAPSMVTGGGTGGSVKPEPTGKSRRAAAATPSES